MKMIPVPPIRIWTKHGAEWTAGTFMHLTHRLAGLWRVPAFEHGNLAAIAQEKLRNINGAAFAMFRDFGPFTMVARAADVVCSNFDAVQPATDLRERWFRAALHPTVQCLRRAAIHDRAGAEFNPGHGRDPHRVLDPAARQAAGHPAHRFPLNCDITANCAFAQQAALLARGAFCFA